MFCAFVMGKIPLDICGKHAEQTVHCVWIIKVVMRINVFGSCLKNSRNCKVCFFINMLCTEYPFDILVVIHILIHIVIIP